MPNSIMKLYGLHITLKNFCAVLCLAAPLNPVKPDTSEY